MGGAEQAQEAAPWSPTARLAALRALEALDEGKRRITIAPRASHLLHMIRDSDEAPGVRLTAVRLLRSLASADLAPGTVPAAVQRLEDADWRMREAVLLFLETVDPSLIMRSADAVVRVCSNADEEPAVKVAAVRVLGRLNPETLDGILGDIGVCADEDGSATADAHAIGRAFIRESLAAAKAAGRNLRLSISTPAKGSPTKRISLSRPAAEIQRGTGPSPDGVNNDALSGMVMGSSGAAVASLPATPPPQAASPTQAASGSSVCPPPTHQPAFHYPPPLPSTPQPRPPTSAADAANSPTTSAAAVGSVDLVDTTSRIPLFKNLDTGDVLSLDTLNGLGDDISTDPSIASAAASVSVGIPARVPAAPQPATGPSPRKTLTGALRHVAASAAAKAAAAAEGVSRRASIRTLNDQDPS